jgi:hypothetical protein
VTTTTQPEQAAVPEEGNKLAAQSRGTVRFRLSPGQVAGISSVDLFSEFNAKWLARGLTFESGGESESEVVWAPLSALRQGLLPWGTSEVTVYDPEGRIMQVHSVTIHDFPVFGPSVASFSGAKQSGASKSGHVLQAWVPLTFGAPEETEAQIPVDWQQIVNQ